MFNRARLIKDEYQDIYLVIYGQPFDNPACFKIAPLSSSPYGYIADLTKQEMLIDLQTKES